MTTFQKIVKYLAMGFATFLIVAIYSGILYAGLGIISAGRLIKNNSSVETKCENIEKTCLQVSLAISKLEIKTGDSLRVDTKNDKVTIKETGNNLIVTENGSRLFGGDRDVVIYVPENLQFEKVGISGGAGSIEIESLRAKQLEMSLGVGKTEINALEVDDAKISTGIGKVSVNLMSKADSYKIKVEKGIGEIKFNDNSVSGSSALGNGPHELSVNSGIGSITINTKQ
ncbi:DUF4097 family beta strand repeat protein [Candidatus Saccharibacteria bacterium]|nr:DUF4097 family beta strand repeat protein [Candidatus Saccharibacteria bacterium]